MLPASSLVAGNRPISVYRLGEMPVQSCGRSVSASRGKAGARLNAHTELRTKRQRSAREAIYRNRPITWRSMSGCCPFQRGQVHAVHGGLRGKPVQVDPIKPTLKAPETKRLKLNYDGPLSNCAFNFNLRRYNVVDKTQGNAGGWGGIRGRGLHSSTFHLNLGRSGHTSPCPPVQYTDGKPCAQRIPRNVLTLSRNVDECKPLVRGIMFAIGKPIPEPWTAAGRAGARIPGRTRHPACSDPSYLE